MIWDTSVMAAGEHMEKGAWWCVMWDVWYYDIFLYAWIRLIHKILWYIWIHNMIWFMQTLDLCMSSISHPQAIRTPLLKCSRQLLRDLNEEVTVWTGPRVSHVHQFTSSKKLRILESQVMDPWKGRKRFLFWKTNLNEPNKKREFFFETHGPSCNGLRDFHWSYLVVYRMADVETFPFCACHVGAAIYRRFHPVGEIQFEGLETSKRNDSTRLDSDYKSEEQNFIHPSPA